MELVDDVGHVESHFFLLESVLVSVHDRCMVRARRTIGSNGSSFRAFGLGARFVSNVPLDRKSFWMHPMELLGDVGHVESHFISFGDSVSVGAR